MAEGSGLENQEVQISSEREQEAATDLENDPDVVEHVDRAKADAIVKRIGDLYHVPQEALDQGKKTEIYIIKTERFDREMASLDKDSLSEEERREVAELALNIDSLTEEEQIKRAEALSKKITDEADRKAEAAREQAERTGGISLPQEEGGSAIIIKEDLVFDREHTEIHEMLHAMSESADGRYHGINGMFTESRNINEAITEILALGVLHPELTAEELSNKINSGEIKSGYHANTLKMLVIMRAASQGDMPFTIQELAKYYFHNFKEERVLGMSMDIMIKRDILAKIGLAAGTGHAFSLAESLLHNDLKNVMPKAA